MSERDPHPAGDRSQPSADPSAWRDDTTPGIRYGEGSPSSGVGATAVGAGGAPVGSAQPGDQGYGGQWPPSTDRGSPYAGPGQPYAGQPYADQDQATEGQAAERQASGRHAEDDGTTPQYSTAPVTVRRPDVLAALLLVLAGVAAGISLLLDWARDARGWDLVEDGLTDLSTRSWPPPAVVLAGGVLLVLGLLVLLPGRSHRTLGVLALLATLVAAAGVLVTLDRLDWAIDGLEPGFWVAAAVPVLGLLGSLKAMLTAPRVR
jgi:hypothetical protein